MNNFLTELVPLKVTNQVSSWMKFHLDRSNSIAVAFFLKTLASVFFSFFFCFFLPIFLINPFVFRKYTSQYNATVFFCLFTILFNNLNFRKEKVIHNDMKPTRTAQSTSVFT